MDLLLLFIYLVILVLQIVLLVGAVRKPGGRRWKRLFAAQALSCCLAVGLGLWFAHLPGRGMMPGLTYFAEVFYSLLAACVYVAMLLVGVIVWAVVRYKNKNSAGN